MATRSAILMRVPDGRIMGVYCHWDGYPEHNGRILHQHYAIEEAVTALLSRGDLSVLDEKLSECEFYKDRGENSPAKYFDSPDLAILRYRNQWCEYFYLFDNDIWWMCDFHNTEWRSLAGVMEDIRESAG